MNSTDAERLTPLMWAAGQGNLETLRWLLQRGVALDATDARGLSAWAIARDAKQLPAVDALRSAGARAPATEALR